MITSIGCDLIRRGLSAGNGLAVPGLNRLTARTLCLGGIVCAMTLVLATIRIPCPPAPTSPADPGSH
ncbi:MAG: hypothetical protein ACLU38_08615 [Dysosmobacter sp.]